MLEQIVFMSMDHRTGGHANAALHRDYPRGYRFKRDQGEDSRRDHPNPHHRDENAEELRPCRLSLVSERFWLFRWRAGPYGFARLCTAEWAYLRRKNRDAAAALGNVSGHNRYRHGSARTLSPGNPVLQRHGDGANHASGPARIGPGSYFGSLVSYPSRSSSMCFFSPNTDALTPLRSH